MKEEERLRRGAELLEWIKSEEEMWTRCESRAGPAASASSAPETFLGAFHFQCLCDASCARPT